MRPQDIKTTALFSVEGELDDISGSGQTEAVHAICSGVVDSEQRHLVAEGAGHYGIFSGRRWREKVYPEVRKFILDHQPKASSPVKQAASPAVNADSAPPVRKPSAKKPAPPAKPIAAKATPAKPKAVATKPATPAAKPASKAKSPASTRRAAASKAKSPASADPAA